MSKISDILTNPTKGLLPYLDSKLEGNYSRFQIRNYTFGSASNSSGFRLRDVSSEVKRPSLSISQGVLVGKMIAITDQVQSQITAAELARDLDFHVYNWSECVCPYLEKPCDRFDGSIAIVQDKGISSANSGGWWAVVTRQFEITYSDRA